MQDQVCILSPELRIPMTWHQVSDWLKKQGGTITTVIVIFGALFAGVRYIVSSEVADIRSDVATLKGDTKTIDDKLGTTNQRIDGLLKDALERAFPKPTPTATKAELKEDFKRADDLVRLARSENIKLNPHLIATYGKEVAASSGQPSISAAAWQTLGNLLNYRAFLNIDFSPATRENFVPVKQGEMTAHVLIAGKGPGTLTVEWPNKLVSAGESFVYQELEDTTALQGKGHAYVLVTGTSVVSLDGFRLKNGIFDGITVQYDGGPLAMENVYFVNCKFQLKPSAPSRLFAEVVLEHVPATFARS